MKTSQTKTHRPLFEIARDIRAQWGGQMNYGARPYVNAMEHLNKITDRYGWDTAESVVRYFLSNAQTWRGEEARAIKQELNDILKSI